MKKVYEVNGFSYNSESEAQKMIPQITKENLTQELLESLQTLENEITLHNTTNSLESLLEVIKNYQKNCVVYVK